MRDPSARTQFVVLPGPSRPGPSNGTSGDVIAYGSELVSHFHAQGRPGCEREVALTIRKLYSDEGLSDDVEIFFGLGESELIVAVDGRKARNQLLGTGTIPNILGSVEVICDALLADDEITEEHGLLSPLAGHDLVSLSFLKLAIPSIDDPDQSSREDRFLQWWEKQEPTEGQSR